MSEYLDYFSIKCDRCGKVLEDSKTVSSSYYQLVFIKATANKDKPIIYQTEHAGRLVLCNDCTALTQEAINNVVSGLGL